MKQGLKLTVTRFIFGFVGLFSLFATATTTLASGSANQSQVQADAGWHKADPKRVCMVTNMEFPRDQIPVKVKDTTYYGCCENCKERLGKDEAVRQAVDPISGKTVDKAKASIAAGPDGSVEYFENDANLKKYVASQK
ncbi:MAG: TRASH domain-containing protein [Proteobacteria bacterium]|nr:MAG: TRASH domain-containing protein [Pseudomonadota bacterium]